MKQCNVCDEIDKTKLIKRKYKSGKIIYCNLCKQCHIARNKNLWKTSNYRYKMKKIASETLSKTWKNQDFRLKMNDILKHRWNNLEYREKMKIIARKNGSVTFKKLWKKDDCRKNMIKLSSERLTKLWQNPAYRLKMSTLASERIIKYNKICWKNPQFRKKMLIYFSSLEHRQKMSNNRIQTLQNSTFSKKYQYNKINFRSNWEVQVAKWLDENNIIWEYESEKCIFNLSSGKHYLIDFYLPRLDCYIEVKGWWDDYSILKFNEAIKTKDIRIVDNRNINNISLEVKSI